MDDTLTLRVASFNILHGQSVTSAAAHSTAHLQSTTEGPTDATDLVAAIDTIAPNVIGLQEVDRNQPRSGLQDQTSLIGQALDPSVLRFVPTVVGTPGGANGFRPTTEAERDPHHGQAFPDYGVSLISQLPVTAWHTRVFPPAPLSLPLLVQTSSRPKLLKVRDEQRAAIAAVIETRTGPLTVVTAHLSFVPGYNIRQLRAIKLWIRALPRPLLLIGDFNLPARVPARVTGFTPVVKEPTFPSYRPRVQFDHILADGFAQSTLMALQESARTWQLPVSDHCAVSVDIPLT